MFVLLLFLSKRAIRPFVDNLERQRQFITDASHELKTPLAILSANLGLLEDTYGEDKWLGSAKSQITRLDRLIKNLVELARPVEAIKVPGELGRVHPCAGIGYGNTDVSSPHGYRQTDRSRRVTVFDRVVQ